MTFLRTISTRRLLAMIAGLVIAAAGGTAIAMAAVGSGPVPHKAKLAVAIHRALSAKAVKGISADITFTNNLISSSDFQGGPKDPILQGATGRLWLTKGHLRLELQSSNGDGQVVVGGRSFWVYDPASNTVYRGTLPAGHAKPSAAKHTGMIPTIAQIQTELNKLAAHLNVSGAQPTDVGGQPAYRVKVSPKHDGGLIGDLQLAWDAAHGIPLDFAVYASGNSTPVLELKVNGISYGAVPLSNFRITPPASAKVVQVASASGRGTAAKQGLAKAKRSAKIHGVAAVAKRLDFPLVARAKLAGLPRQSVTLLSWGGHPAALLTYGKGLGGIAVVERKADAKAGPINGSGNGNGGLALPTVSINGATAHELDTPLGTVVQFTRGGVSFIVAGSVPAVAADAAARGL